MTRKTIAPSRSSMSRINPTRAGVSCRSDKRIATAPMRITASPVQHKPRRVVRRFGGVAMAIRRSIGMGSAARNMEQAAQTIVHLAMIWEERE